MQQILASMNELNDRAQNAEARATEAEQQAQATQQELVRSKAGVKFEGEDDKWREWARVFRSWSGRFFGGALAEIHQHVEGHRNDSATILDLALMSLRFAAGLLRNSSTELFTC